MEVIEQSCSANEMVTLAVVRLVPVIVKVLLE
jgi:hypothetical protein